MFFLNILVLPPIFHFLVFKISKDEDCFFISFLKKIPFFFIKKIQLTIHVHTHVIFLEFGLHLSNLHINVYHEFDGDFE
jgi:riboflavin transporter FmnP